MLITSIKECLFFFKLINLFEIKKNNNFNLFFIYILSKLISITEIKADEFVIEDKTRIIEEKLKKIYN